MTHSFITREDGAVTVDWVVLTAALVGLGLGVMLVVSNGLDDLSGDVDGELRAERIILTSFGGAADAAAAALAAYTPVYPSAYNVGRARVLGDEYNSPRDAVAEYTRVSTSVTGHISDGNREAAQQGIDFLAGVTSASSEVGIDLSGAGPDLAAHQASFAAAFPDD